MVKGKAKDTRTTDRGLPMPSRKTANARQLSRSEDALRLFARADAVLFFGRARSTSKNGRFTGRFH